MLARENRLTSADDFRSTMRGGIKHTTAHLIFYLKRVEATSARFGFVTSKAVGGAVQRNLVKRRLRALAREVLVETQNFAVVVRVQPGAAQLTWVEISKEFKDAVTVLLAKAAR